MRVATATRVARVAVAVGETVMVAVAVEEGVKVAVEEAAIVNAAVTETVILGCLLSLSVDVEELPNRRYTKIALMETIRLIIPIMNNDFFTSNLMQAYVEIILSTLQQRIPLVCSIS